MIAHRTARDYVVAAAVAHSNLTTWGAVVALLEGGLLYGATPPAKGQVIAIAKREQKKLLRAYDIALSKTTRGTS